MTRGGISKIKYVEIDKLKSAFIPSPFFLNTWHETSFINHFFIKTVKIHKPYVPFTAKFSCYLASVE